MGIEICPIYSSIRRAQGGGGEFLIFSLETLSFTDRQLIVIGVAVNLSGQNVVVRRRIIIGRYIYIDCRVIYLERNE